MRTSDSSATLFVAWRECYQCDAFYDPLRCEHREVSFGFLSYSLPLSNGPSRAWRFAWDPIFWEFCTASAGALRFDLATYHDLSPAARRLFLLLKKLFWRADHSPELELRDLGIHALGFSPATPTKEIKRKVLAIVRDLLAGDCTQSPGTTQEKTRTLVDGSAERWPSGVLDESPNDRRNPGRKTADTGDIPAISRAAEHDRPLGCGEPKDIDTTRGQTSPAAPRSPKTISPCPVRSDTIVPCPPN